MAGLLALHVAHMAWAARRCREACIGRYGTFFLVFHGQVRGPLGGAEFDPSVEPRDEAVIREHRWRFVAVTTIGFGLLAFGGLLALPLALCAG